MWRVHVCLLVPVLHRCEDGLQGKGQEFLFTNFRLVFLGCSSRLVRKKWKRVLGSNIWYESSYLMIAYFSTMFLWLNLLLECSLEKHTVQRNIQTNGENCWIVQIRSWAAECWIPEHGREVMVVHENKHLYHCSTLSLTANFIGLCICDYVFNYSIQSTI